MNYAPKVLREIVFALMEEQATGEPNATWSCPPQLLRSDDIEKYAYE